MMLAAVMIEALAEGGGGVMMVAMRTEAAVKLVSTRSGDVRLR